MKRLKKIIYRLLIFTGIVYMSICSYMYFMQEAFIFHPEKIGKTEKIHFNLNDEEMNFRIDNNTNLNGILCKTNQKNRKRLIFFLHGNAGNLFDQEQAAKFYTAHGFDFFTFDYRTFGKSTGKLIDQEQFFGDVDLAYEEMKKQYSEDSIIVIGYSLGTAPAAMITSRKKPSKLVLIAPYFSLIDMTQRQYPILPSFLLKYKFETNKFLKIITRPVLLFHGDADEVIPFESSILLSKLLKKGDAFVAIKSQGHDDFEKNKLFESKIFSFLNN